MYQNSNKPKQDKQTDMYNLHLMHFMLHIKHFNTIHSKKRTKEQQELHKKIT